MKFGLTDSQLGIFRQLCVEPLQTAGATVWIFGSRARGDNHQFSDIDVLYGFPEGTHCPQGLIGAIQESLENSNLAVKVDLVDLKNLARSYAANVLRERVRWDYLPTT